MQFQFPRYWDKPFHPVRVHPTPLGAGRVTLPPSCAATEVHLPTPVLGQTLSPRQGPSNTIRCEESGAATSLRCN
ncbi:hypothetical protein E2C01_029022 [Portunus trituberculatus]|uniref:Uncharacterized protein n=1 Tax=Portunus trituberculatus TaxID=210409 RepID=A0A5B7EQR2_PORTR|nr:hypothetical protein [Portunus trituberculatus]